MAETIKMLLIICPAGLLGMVFVVYRLRRKNGEYSGESSYSEYRGDKAAEKALKDVRNDISQEDGRVSSTLEVRHDGQIRGEIDYPDGSGVDFHGEWSK